MGAVSDRASRKAAPTPRRRRPGRAGPGRVGCCDTGQREVERLERHHAQAVGVRIGDADGLEALAPQIDRGRHRRRAAEGGGVGPRRASLRQGRAGESGRRQDDDLLAAGILSDEAQRSSIGEAAATNPNTLPPASAGTSTTWCGRPSTSTTPRTGPAGHGRLDPARGRLGQGERREGVAASDDAAALVEHEQQFVAGIAFAVIGQEVADGRRIGPSSASRSGNEASSRATSVSRRSGLRWRCRGRRGSSPDRPTPVRSRPDSRAGPRR